MTTGVSDYTRLLVVFGVVTGFLLVCLVLVATRDDAQPERPCQALHRSLEQYGPFNYPQLAQAYLEACSS